MLRLDQLTTPHLPLLVESMWYWKQSPDTRLQMPLKSANQTPHRAKQMSAHKHFVTRPSPRPLAHNLTSEHILSALIVVYVPTTHQPPILHDRRSPKDVPFVLEAEAVHAHPIIYLNFYAAVMSQ